MIDCKFDISVDDLELHLEEVYIYSEPEKDEEGNWNPILMNFKPDDNGPIWEIFSKFYNFGPTSNITNPVHGSAMLSISDDTYCDNWKLHNVWPKSLKFDDNNNCEVLWRFNSATLL